MATTTATTTTTSVVGSSMSQAAALLVPLGVPRPPKQDEQSQLGLGVRALHDFDPNDPWASDDGDEGPVCSPAWFQSLQDDAQAVRGGDVRFAVGYADGSITVYARNVRAQAEEKPPESPARKESPQPRAGMTRRAHRHNLQMLVSGMYSPPASNAGADSEGVHSGATSGRASASTDSSGHLFASYGAPDPATVSMSQATAPAVIDENSPHQAENLLEAQFNASDAPRVQHPNYVPKARARADIKEVPHAQLPPDIKEPPRAQEGSSGAWALDASAPCRCMCRIYSPDASAIVALRVSDRVEGTAYLVSHQASGRVCIWDMELMELIGSGIVTQGGGALEHQTFGAAFHTLARAKIAQGKLNEVHIVQSDEAYAALCFDGWACVVRAERARAALVVCGMVRIPDEGRPLAWSMVEGTVTLAYSARGGVRTAKYTLSGNTAAAHERILSCTTRPTMGREVPSVQVDMLEPELVSEVSEDVGTAALFVSHECIVGTSDAILGHAAVPSPVERLVDLGAAVGVICREHVAVFSSGRLAPIRERAAMCPVPMPGAMELIAWPQDVLAPLPWTAVCPQSVGRIVVALEHGLALTSLGGYAQHESLHAVPESLPLWDAKTTLLQIVVNPRTGTRYVVGGSEKGDVAIWDASSLRMLAGWSCFAAPVQAVVPLGTVPRSSHLWGCAMCVATDGTCALLTLDDVRLVQLFPRDASALTLVGVHNADVLLVYGDRTGRWWNTSTRELVRVVEGDDLHRTLHDASLAWACVRIPAAGNTHAAPGMLMPSACAQSDASSLLLADMRRAVDVGAKHVRGACGALAPFLDGVHRQVQTSSDLDVPSMPPEQASKLRGVLAPIIAALVPVDLDAVFCLDRVDALPSWPGCVQAHGVLLVCADPAPSARFCVSPECTALHLLVNTALALLFLPVDVQSAQRMLHALLTPEFMVRIVRPRTFVFPSLSFFAPFVLDESEVLRAAAKLLLPAYIRAASTQVLRHTERVWTPHLPAPGRPAPALASRAVLVLGLLCFDRYAYFSPTLLKRIAAFVLQFLTQPERDSMQAYMALELCAGCHVWQHYIDTVDLVRHMFRFATQDEGDAGAAKLSLRGLARRATLDLAERHSALFMTTLAMDILHAPSVEQSQVTQRLVAFMIHQKPLVLYPSLPRLVEAVVKSLDPTHAGVRSSLAQSATLIIRELVHTYPMIAFHGGTQRLAVGTHDGPVVMYDLKSATRLFVLDGHKRAVTACSFSPDGRRFLSMSLDEEVVLIWRLHAGVFDMFRRSDASSHTYRAIHFHLGSAAQLSPADTLRHVHFDWHDARSVQLCIGQAHVNVGVV